MKNGNRYLALLLVAFLLAATLSACGDNVADKIPGTWTNGYSTYTFYSDGTYEESGHYGTGTWTVLDGDLLKFTNFYGESTTYPLKDVSASTITFDNGATDWTRVR